MFLCSPLTANRGRPGSRPCLVTIRPRSTTAVISSSATTPVARLAYHNAVEELIPLTFSSIVHKAQRSIERHSEQTLNGLSRDSGPAETYRKGPTPAAPAGLTCQPQQLLSPGFTNGVPPGARSGRRRSPRPGNFVRVLPVG